MDINKYYNHMYQRGTMGSVEFFTKKKYQIVVKKYRLLWVAFSKFETNSLKLFDAAKHLRQYIQILNHWSDAIPCHPNSITLHCANWHKICPYMHWLYRYKIHYVILGPLSTDSRHIFPSIFMSYSWWRHQMETFSALLALCAGNHRSPVNSPHKGQ